MPFLPRPLFASLLFQLFLRSAPFWWFVRQESVDVIMRRLVKEGILVGAPTLPNGLPYPDGDEIVDLLVPKDQVRNTLRAGQRHAVVWCEVVWCGVLWCGVMW